jgi:hypothetical protein
VEEFFEGKPMKNCDQVQRNLYKLLEEDPSSPICQALKAHLEYCEVCAQYYKELADVVELCRAFPEEPLSEEHKHKLKHFLQKELWRDRPERSSTGGPTATLD